MRVRWCVGAVVRGPRRGDWRVRRGGARVRRGGAPYGGSMSTPLRDRVPFPAGGASLPTGPAGVRWRRLTAADAPEVYELRRRAGRVDHPNFVVSREEIESDLTRVELAPDRDTAGATDVAGRLVAYGLVVRPAESESLVKVLLDGHVDPDRRGEGIGRRLLDWQQARGLEILAEHEEPLPGWLLTQSDVGSAHVVDLLQRAGFEPRRYWLELRRDLAEPIPEAPLEAGLRIVDYSPAVAEPVRLAKNEAFRDHWGSQPMSADDWAARDELPIARHDLSFVVLDGDEVAGFLLTTVNAEESEQLGFPFGYVELVGTRAAYRGRGVARALLVHALAAFREAGLEQAVLDVDSESPTGAVGLYASVGFREANRSLSLVREW
ncbi:putative acetyltransferase, GNAT [Cnuibacter physcomitrellae]|nr:putative acetyltransferase, GNAT [Cnuibacter physcomitrellae]